MNILWFTPSDMLTEQYHGSLSYYLYEHNISYPRENSISYHWYDKHGSPPDRAMLDVVDRQQPDIVVYISQAGGPYCAEADTFRRIRDKVPIVHLCLDAYDIGFDALLTEYRAKGCFSFTVACDGGAHTPENVDWIGFHPVDPRPYEKQGAVRERPFALGTCGGFPYGRRLEVFERLRDRCGMVVKPREEVYGSYPRYARFLTQCGIVMDCAVSAGGHGGAGPFARTLKTRAIEVGLAGACLLELRGCALENWAVPDVDYPTYETPDEAEAVVKRLLDDPAAVAQFGQRLQGVVRETMYPDIFWSIVFAQSLR